MGASVALVEVWLREWFPDATIESERIGRVPDLSLTQTVDDERNEYFLFRVTRPGRAQLHIGASRLALEQLSESELQDGIRLVVDQATTGAYEDDLVILTIWHGIVHEKKGKR